MSSDDLAAIRPHVTRVPLPAGLVLHSAGDLIEWIYFPEDGIASIVVDGRDGTQCEVGVIGYDGMSGTAALHWTERSPHRVYMQIGGISGLRISTAALRQTMRGSDTLVTILLGYMQTMIVQSASSIAAASIQSLEPRLARWLMMYLDRLGDKSVGLSHLSISRMLGTRRAGVTLALQRFEAIGVIKMTRSRVTMTDLDGLEQLAGASYGFAEAEYNRLIGQTLRRANDRQVPSGIKRTQVLA